MRASKISVLQTPWRDRGETALAMDASALRGACLSGIRSSSSSSRTAAARSPPILGRLARNYELLREAGENVADPQAGLCENCTSIASCSQRTLCARCSP